MKAVIVYDSKYGNTEKIAKSLKKKGANLLLPPEGFLVLGTEGPLMDGEFERAAAWAKRIVDLKEDRNV